MKNIFKIIFIFLFFYTIYLFIPNKYTVEANIYLESSEQKNDFINSIAPAAVADMKKTGVYASTTIGQAVIESGWGNNKIAKVYGNYFGMKTGSSIYVNGIEATCNKANINMIGYANLTNEYWSGMAVCLKASEGVYSWFRVYDNIENSIGDHSRNLWCISDGRYIKNGVFNSSNSQIQLYTIAKSGYAVDASGNISIIDGLRYDEYIYNKIIVPNNFEIYDSEYADVKPDYASTCTSTVYTGEIPELPNNSNNSNNENNSVSDFSTTYTGDITQGYIYKTQKNLSLKIEESTSADEIEDRINKTIDNIFENASNYSNISVEDFEIVTDNKNALNWKQYDADWGSISMGNSGKNIKQIGCLATSVSIEIALSGTKVNTDNFNPGTFIQYLNGHSGFDSKGQLYWDNRWSGLVPNFQFVAKESLGKTKQEKINKISDLLNDGYYVVMCSKTGCGHWVAVTGVTSDNINIADPGSSATTLWPKYNAIANDSTLKVSYFKKID